MVKIVAVADVRVDGLSHFRFSLSRDLASVRHYCMYAHLSIHAHAPMRTLGGRFASYCPFYQATVKLANRFKSQGSLKKQHVQRR